MTAGRVVRSPGIIAPTNTLYGDGNFSINMTNNSGGFNTKSNIFLPAGMNLDNVTWKWQQVSGPEVLTFIEHTTPEPPHGVSAIGTPVNGYAQVVVWVGIRPVNSPLQQNNYHLRFVVTDGTNTHKSFARLQSSGDAGYDANWNNVGYEPSWVQGNDNMAAEIIFSQDGIVL